MRRRRNPRPEPPWFESFEIEDTRRSLFFQIYTKEKNSGQRHGRTAHLIWVDPEGDPIDAQGWIPRGPNFIGKPARKYELQLPLGAPANEWDWHGENILYVQFGGAIRDKRYGYKNVGITDGFWIRVDPKSGAIREFLNQSHAKEVVKKHLRPLDMLVVQMMITRIYELVEAAGASRLLRRW